MAKLIIKKSSSDFSLTTDRSHIVDVAETADGVCINFKGGIQVVAVDMDMPSSTKQLIKNSLDSYPGKKLIVDLDKYRQPVLVDAT
jgi:hypothetical protein